MELQMLSVGVGIVAGAGVVGAAWLMMQYMKFRKLVKTTERHELKESDGKKA